MDTSSCMGCGARSYWVTSVSGERGRCWSRASSACVLSNFGRRLRLVWCWNHSSSAQLTSVVTSLFLQQDQNQVAMHHLSTTGWAKKPTVFYCLYLQNACIDLCHFCRLQCRFVLNTSGICEMVCQTQWLMPI